PRAISPVLMYIACITIGTAMLTALIRVHAVPHAYIRTVHLVDDALGMLFQEDSLRVGIDPFIDGLDVLFHPLVLQEPVLWIELSASSFFVLLFIALFRFFLFFLNAAAEYFMTG